MKKKIISIILKWIANVPVPSVSLRASVALAGVNMSDSHFKCTNPIPNKKNV